MIKNSESVYLLRIDGFVFSLSMLNHAFNHAVTLSQTLLKVVEENFLRAKMFRSIHKILVESTCFFQCLRKLNYCKRYCR